MKPGQRVRFNEQGLIHAFPHNFNMRTRFGQMSARVVDVYEMGVQEHVVIQFDDGFPRCYNTEFVEVVEPC